MRARLPELFMAAIIAAALAALLMGLIPGLGFSAHSQDVNLGSSGEALVGLADNPDPDSYLLSTAAIQVSTSDISDDGGGADHVSIDALISDGLKEYRLRVRRGMPEDPLGRFRTGAGVLQDVSLADLADGYSWLPDQSTGFAAFGYGDVTCHGDLLGMGLPVRVFTVESGFPGNTRLVLDIGDERIGIIKDMPSGRQGTLRVMWPGYLFGYQPIPATDEAAGVCPL